MRNRLHKSQNTCGYCRQRASVIQCSRDLWKSLYLGMTRNEEQHDGWQTVDYTEPDDSIEQTGLIGLQIHGGPPSEAWYKDIRLKELN